MKREAHMRFTFEEAEKLLSSRFRRTKQPTKKMAGFELPTSRQPVLRRERESVRVILELTPPQMDGIELEKIYQPHTPRSSNLAANAPRLAMPSPACLVIVRSEGALDRLLEW
jgi:hypothetical protein